METFATAAGKARRKKQIADTKAAAAAKAAADVAEMKQKEATEKQAKFDLEVIGITEVKLRELFNEIDLDRSGELDETEVR